MGSVWGARGSGLKLSLLRSKKGSGWGAAGGADEEEMRRRGGAAS